MKAQKGKWDISRKNNTGDIPLALIIHDITLKFNNRGVD